VLAGGAGILILPITSLNPGTYTLFVVPALGAALVGRFTSFPITVAAGLGIGMLQSELIKLQTVWDWLPKEGLQEGVPFLVIVIAMIALAGRLPSRGGIRDAYTASIGRPRAPVRTTGVSFVIGLVAILVVSELYRSAIASSLITACVCLSVVIITGYVGQISLAQNAFAGLSAFMVAHISAGLGLGFPFGLILAALCAVVLGVVIGRPAVRIRGVNLAVVTLAAAAALDALVFVPEWFSGGFNGKDAPPPHLFGLDLGIADDGSSTVFAIFVLVIVCLMGLLVARTKLLAFGVSAFVAGIGGGLLAYQQGDRQRRVGRGEGRRELRAPARPRRGQGRRPRVHQAPRRLRHPTPHPGGVDQPGDDHHARDVAGGARPRGPRRAAPGGHPVGPLRPTRAGRRAGGVPRLRRGLLHQRCRHRHRRRGDRGHGLTGHRLGGGPCVARATSSGCTTTRRGEREPPAPIRSSSICVERATSALMSWRIVVSSNTFQDARAMSSKPISVSSSGSVMPRERRAL
jgi:branched-subunit amino acid ABC-type transport system permease component